ncbi:MAG: SURF1 family protein [Pseudomonadota bacterium]
MTKPNPSPTNGSASAKVRRRFKATFWPTVITIPSILILIGLGFWQLHRLDWKQELIDERQSRSQGPALSLSQVPGDLDQAEFMLVEVTGTFLHDQEFYLGARTREGRVGYHIVTPFQLQDGGSLFIDRGWVPQNRKEPTARIEGQTEGGVTLQGLVRTDGWKGVDFAKPDNLPDERFYFWLDLPVMAATAEMPQLITDFYVEAGPAPNPGGLPKGGQSRINLPNDHLEYALTWFALAIALAVIYFFFHYRPENSDTPSAGTSKEP